MTEYVIAVLIGCAATSLAWWLAGRLVNDGAEVALRLAALEPPKAPEMAARESTRRRVRDRVAASLYGLGGMVPGAGDPEQLRTLLLQAGYRSHSAPSVYQGGRAAAMLTALAVTPFFLTSMGPTGWLMGLGGVVAGWVAPAFYVGHRVRSRRAQMRRAVPDMLDALVVSMEAGLGLFQALQRVAEQSRQISPHLSAELTVTNLEIRTGVPRDEALRGLADRVGLSEIRALTSALIQTDRFGTSVTHALRVQADTLREKRRQQAEEAAAKTTIKMIFPLVFFIFPSLFVVTLGPAIVQVVEMLGR